MKSLNNTPELNIFKYTWQPLVLLVATFLCMILYSQTNITKKNALGIREQINAKISDQYTSLAEEGYLVREKALESRITRIANDVIDANTNVKTLCMWFSFAPRENTPKELISTCPQIQRSNHSDVHHQSVILGNQEIGKISYAFETKRNNSIFLLTLTYIAVSLLIAFIFHFFFSSRVNKTIIKPLLLEIERAAVFKAQAEIARQVAHDVRSPLSTLSFAISEIEDFPFEKRIIVENAYQRINDIANNLLNKGSHSSQANINKSVQLFRLIDGVISEKRFEFRNKPNITFTSDFKPEALSLFSKVNESEFCRVLSNIINNSVEAYEDHKGIIKIELKLNHNTIIVTVKDSGKGMPESILSKLGNEVFTYGKGEGYSGSGIGLLHAFQTIKKWSGNLIVSSKEGEGTSVQIELPISQTPKWFSNSVSIPATSKIIVLDDDPSIHRILSEKFKNHPVIHFQSPVEWKEWISENGKADAFFICDYDLNGFNENGLDLIVSYDLQRQALLISSYLEDEKVTSLCEEKDLKGFPKRIIHHLKVTTLSTDPQFVFIDDDKFMRLGWNMEATKANIPILTFKSIEEFLEFSPAPKLSTPIYIDSHLGNDIRGELDSRRILEKGFINLHLATSYSSTDIEKPDWIKSIVGKSFPTQLS